MVSNETSSAVLLHGTISFSIFYKMQFGIFLEFFLALLEVKGLTLLQARCSVPRAIHRESTRTNLQPYANKLVAAFADCSG